MHHPTLERKPILGTYLNVCFAKVAIKNKMDIKTERIYSHVKFTHKILNPKSNTHYFNNTLKYRIKLEELYKKCYPDYGLLVK